jgi:tRNA threonylcarbamoyladenosine biosynthesis protein TsaE
VTATARGSLFVQVETGSAAATRAVAVAIRPLLVPGDVLLLGGDLGAGKTTFTQGLARAMGIYEQVTSPTFTLIRTYEGPGSTRLLHADLYRLDHLQEVMDLGLAELLDEGAVAVIEWGDLAAPVLLRDYLEVRIDFGAGDDDRILALEAVGQRWVARLPALRQAVVSNGP